MIKRINILIVFMISIFSTVHPQTSVYGILEGTVVDSVSKEPLIGVNIIILGTTMGTTSDLQGHFELRKIPTGRYQIKSTIMGYRSQTVSVQILSSQTTSIHFKMKETVLEMPALVVTAGKKAQSFQDVPNSVSLISAREIERRNRTYLNEVLDYTPGVNVIEGDVNIRGSSGFSLGAGSRVLLLVDGIPMMPGDSGDIKWDIIPLSQIERVEIIKGAGSALYGSHAVGGIINIISKEPSATPATEIKFSAGIYDKPHYPEWQWTDRLLHFSQTDITHSRKWKKIGLLVSAGRRSSTGYQQNGEYINWNLLGRADVQFNSQTRLIIQSNFSTSEHGEIFYWRNQNDVFEMPINSVGDWVNSTKFSFNTVYRQLISPKLTYKIRTSYFENYWKHHYHDNDDYSEAKKLGVELQGDYIINKKHSLTFGCEGAYDITNSALFGDHNGSTWAIFFQDEIHVHDLITATVGFRHDYHYVDTGNHDYQFNPKFGITIKPSLFTTIRSSIGRGFRSPTMAEMFTETTTSGFRVVPNPDLKAEKAWSYEIGINQILSRNLLIDIAAFHNDYENFIEPERDEQNTIFFINASRARIRGFELLMQSSWWKKRLNFTVSYTYLDPQYVSKDKTFWWWFNELTGKEKSEVSYGEPLAYRPKNLLTCSFSFNYKAVEVGVDYRYVSRLDSVKVFPREDRVPQKVLDTRIRFNFDNLTISANINNLLNYNYTQVERNLAPIRHYVLTVSSKF